LADQIVDLDVGQRFVALAPIWFMGNGHGAASSMRLAGR
jgi:hypothetical protein